jgi:hypothetical protein
MSYVKSHISFHTVGFPQIQIWRQQNFWSQPCDIQTALRNSITWRIKHIIAYHLWTVKRFLKSNSSSTSASNELFSLMLSVYLLAIRVNPICFVVNMKTKLKMQHSSFKYGMLMFWLLASLISCWQKYRASWHSGNSLASYVGDARLQSRAGHHLSWLSFRGCPQYVMADTA